MSFMKSIFGKGKKKEEKEEPKREVSNFKRDGNRRSIAGDRSYGAEHLPSFYQSVGVKYGRGSKSCTGGEREGDDESLVARSEFEHKRRSKRGILVNRREERNSDYSSQDPSPMSSHFSRREREAPTRHYHSSLDESDEENMDYHVMDKIREKLRIAEEQRMRWEEKYKNAKRQFREEREKEKMRVNDQYDLLSNQCTEVKKQYAELKKQWTELKNENQKLKKELEKRRREDDHYESSFDTHSTSKLIPVKDYDAMMTQMAELRHLKTQLRSPYMAPYAAPFPSMPFPGFPGLTNYRSTPTGTPSTSIVGDSTHDGAGESLVDPSDNSYVRPFDASLSETMPAMFSSVFPFSAPPPATETPRSDNRTASTLSLHEQSETLADSSFRPPVPSTMPPRRISQSNPDVSPSRKTSHSM